MIAVDTNVLIYAQQTQMPEHKKAFAVLKELAEGNRPWAITWPNIYEFIRVSTHNKLFTKTTSLKNALAFIKSVIESPTIRVLSHSSHHWEKMQDIILKADASGNLSFDAQIASILLENGVSEIITNDGDFHRFKDLKVNNPFR